MSVAPGTISLNTITDAGAMSVTDHISGLSYLIDSGADISVFPVTSFSNCALKPDSGTRLRAANGSHIDTFGTKSLKLHFSDFSTKHSFRLASVAQPILGADFFRRHSLLIDVRNNRLLRSTDHSPARPLVVSQLRTGQSYQELLASFPAVTTPRFDTEHVPAHGVHHVVPTSGSPVFARARPLFADKLAVAKQ